MPKIFQGRIVYSEIADSNGHNRYRRPVVILTQSAEIPKEEDLVGVVCSATAASKQPRPHTYIEVPHHPRKLVCTKLAKPTVAVCTWLVLVQQSTLAPRDIEGHVSKQILEQIIQKCNECFGDRFRAD